MKSNILNFSRKLLLPLLLTLSVASAHAVYTGTRGLPASETPLTLQEFKVASEREGRKQWTPVQYMSYSFHWVKAEENTVGVFAELGRAMGTLRPEEIAALQEFKNLQQEMVRRGYEPAVKTNWVSGKELSFRYDDPMYGEAGPRQTTNDDDETVYVHEFAYKFSINFQKKDRPLESHEDYPRVTFNGFFSLECKSKWDDCRITHSSAKSAEVSWELVPGYRTGGNSSAGGGPRSQFSMDKAMLSKEEIDKISKSSRSK